MVYSNCSGFRPGAPFLLSEQMWMKERIVGTMGIRGAFGNFLGPARFTRNENKAVAGVKWNFPCDRSECDLVRFCQRTGFASDIGWIQWTSHSTLVSPQMREVETQMARSAERGAHIRPPKPATNPPLPLPASRNRARPNSTQQPDVLFRTSLWLWGIYLPARHPSHLMCDKAQLEAKRAQVVPLRIPKALALGP